MLFFTIILIFVKPIYIVYLQFANLIIDKTQLLILLCLVGLIF